MTIPVASHKHADRLSSILVYILVAYYVFLFFFGFWLLFDVWAHNYKFLSIFGVSARELGITGIGEGTENARAQVLEALSLTIVGGFWGSILYSIKMLFNYYAKQKRFDKEWFGKYLTAPFEGAGLAIIVLAIIRGGVAVFGGTIGTETTPVNDFTTFATAALVGFGMRDVVGWLEKLVRNMFAEETKERSSPPTSLPTPVGRVNPPPTGGFQDIEESADLVNTVITEQGESETETTNTVG